MPTSVRELVLLIDGNNLAHFLYTNLVPGQKMTPEDAHRLIQHLNNYTRQYGERVSIECCLDRPALVDVSNSGSLRILAVRYPKKADDLLLDRFWFHHYSRRPCLVITNDQAILDEVQAAGGSTMLVSTFVRRPGLHNPVLRDPDDLPPVLVPPLPEESPSPSSPVIGTSPQEPPEPGRPAGQPAAPRVAQAAAVTGSPPASGEPPAPAEPPAEAGQSLPDEPGYRLQLDNWPPAEGVRFLLASFCPLHRQEIADLFSSLDPAEFSAADLRELAGLLVATCGGEPDFVIRGGSLMDKVRLALLQVPGGELLLGELARRIQMKPDGLRGRIKAKAHPWVYIALPG